MIAPAFDAMLPLLCRVEQMRQETHDTFTLKLRLTNGVRELPFLPGQFNMLYVFGVGEVPISISGNPNLPDVLVHTTREVGIVTKAMSQLKPGSTLGVRGPFGNPWPVQEAEGNDVVIVAGGIGLAPLRPVLYHLLARREKYGKIVLLYGTRTPSDILYRKELEKWRAHFDLEVFVTVDRATNGWHGDVGVVTTLISRASFEPFSSTALICGPEVMMRFSVLELQKRGIRSEDIFVSMERNMKCAVGFCGHCQFGPKFICKDGPVMRYDEIKDLLAKREV
jgi:NAD(P)H-flavin reductase